MIVILFILCIVSSGFTGNIYKKLAGESTSLTASALMPPVWYLMLTAFFGVMTLFEKNPVPAAVLPAMTAGICMFAAACILIEAMKRGTFSVPVIIINLNFIIPVVLSSLFLDEKAAALQLIGMVSSVAVIVLLNLRGGTSAGEPAVRKAILLSVAACAANGLVNFCIKLNERSGGSAYRFFTILYLTAALCGILFALLLCAVQRKKLPLKEALSPRLLPWLSLLGICNGVCFYMTERIAGHMNAAAQFTITTAASILLSLSVGILLGQEKLTKKVVLSFILCLAAVGCQALSLQ